MIHAPLFRALPPAHRHYSLPVHDVTVDLADPPQLSIVKARAGRLEMGAVEFLEKTLQPGDVFLDIGANWGYFTCIASRLVGEAGRVIPVEPMTSTYQRLLESIVRNGAHNAVPINAAVSDKHGELVRFARPWYRQSTAAHLSEGAGTVRTVTLDWLAETIDLQGRRLGAIKIDVEGVEERVLKGARRLLARHSPPIIIEATMDSERYGGDRAGVFAELSAQGYRPTWQMPGDGTTLERYGSTDAPSGQFVFERAGAA